MVQWNIMYLFSSVLGGLNMMSFNADEVVANGVRLQVLKYNWIEYQTELGGEPKVAEFIADICFHGTYGVLAEYSVETIRSLFEADTATILRRC